MADTLKYQKAQIRIEDLSKGVNNKLHAIYVDDSQSVDLQDIDLSIPGQLKTRNGYALIANNPTTNRVRGIFHYAPDGGTKQLIGIEDTSPQSIRTWTGTGNWAAASTISAFAQTNEVNAAQLNGVLFMVNGAGSAVSWDGTKIQMATATNTDFPSGTKVLSYWLGRLWTANNSTNPGYVWFSDALQALTASTASSFGGGWDRTNHALRVGPNTGQKIVALLPLRSGRMIVFMDRSIWQIDPVDVDIFGLGAFGVPTTTSWRLTVIDPIIGCGAERSVSLIGSDAIFMDQYGNIRSLQQTATDAAQGTRSLPLSDSIQGFVDLFTQSALSTASAYNFGTKYYLSVAYNGTTTPNRTFVFDVTLGSWTGPWQFGNARWESSDVETAGQYRLYGSQAESQFRVFRYESGAVNAIGNAAIPYQETTKRYTFGDLNRQKIGRLLIVNAVSTDDADMTVAGAVDGGGFTSLGTFNLAGNAETLPQSLPFTLGGGGITIGKFPLEVLGRFRDVQFRFSTASQASSAGVTVKKLGHQIFATFEDTRKSD